mmetsp:Transcript_26285/g.30250  ORF Transcript_26285/g.30250 Transcript_26285/m.30250 type:complete len:203 (+) Transcript_26285:2755-3363(+)
MRAWPPVRFSVDGMGTMRSLVWREGPWVVVVTFQRMADREADSRGSPRVSSSTTTRLWQAARTRPDSLSTCVIGVRLLSLVPSFFSIFFFFPLIPPFPKLSCTKSTINFKLLFCTTPTATNSSVVKVPVLSNKQLSNFPAIGTRNGSVQNTFIFINVMRLLFTANAICIGSSGGITLVMISMQCNKSSYLERLSFSNPFFKT